MYSLSLGYFTRNFETIEELREAIAKRNLPMSLADFSKRNENRYGRWIARKEN